MEFDYLLPLDSSNKYSFDTTQKMSPPTNQTYPTDAANNTRICSVCVK